MSTLSDLSRPLTIPQTGSRSDLDNQKEFYRIMRKVLKYAYWIIGLGFVVTICYILFNTYSRQVASILIFIGSILALFYYYVKWFFVDNKDDWPTGTSLCPDYLTPISPGFKTNFDGSISSDAGGVFKCVDFVGVSTNGMLRRSTPGDVSQALSDPAFHVAITPSMTKAEIKAMLRQKGLTWISMFSDDDQ